ncbi:P-loop NTPase fold protein [Enterococcus sp. CR-Ec1]|uniref:P-loop NTPase fold protein n=1 Tax=Enterococcus sp. CR-Ec1 TaxID=2057791 RepID=UPI000C783222|nr:P-loop NTPase fold protein [Enterococcus sp. CR-Ec1]AUJ87424.1 protein MraZ [Enterococcus sp. CR-Ec1]
MIPFFIIIIVILILVFVGFLNKYDEFRKTRFQKKDKESELLNHIDVSDRAAYLAGLLENNLTFFLNGEWGTGKSDYLEEVEKHTKKKKFVYLNLWNIKDERSVISISFSLLHPIINSLYRLFLIGCVVVSILITPAINIGIGSFLVNIFGEGIVTQVIFFVGTIIALFVAVWQFFKYKSDEIYYRFFQKEFSTFLMKNKVLVIDDFDRVSPTNQEEAYKLFNCLDRRLPVIFVGDYSKFKDKDKYLQKIIDQKIELPYDLHPNNIWEPYFSHLESMFAIQISKSLPDIFIAEKRNLRERKMFNYYVNHELVERAKKDFVQINQQLAIIYLYLFYADIYQELVAGKSLDSLSKDTKSSIGDLVSLLSETDGYPRSFTANRQGYILYEKVLSLPEEEVLALLDNSNIEETIISDDPKMADVQEYIRRNYSKLDEDLKERLLSASLLGISNNKKSDLIYDFIVLYRGDVINRIDSNNTQLQIENWDKILNDYTFDLSQRLYFYVYYLRISYFKLSEFFPDLNLKSDEYIEGKMKRYYFLTYLTIKDRWFKFQWPQYYWEALDLIYKDNHKEYLNVLKVLNLIKVDFESKHIIAYESIYNDVYSNYLEGIGEVLDNIKPKLAELKELGYTIEYQNQLNISLS